MLPIARLFRPQGDDRVAVVCTEPAFGKPNRYLIRVARGAHAQKLTGGTEFGPVDADQLQAAYNEVLANLSAEGFRASGVFDLLKALDCPDPAARASAALRLGWRRSPEAVEPLLAKLPQAVDDLCSVIDALGMLGDNRAVPPLREIAKRKLLSRRRSAIEALRQLGDTEGLETILAEAKTRLPDAVCNALSDQPALITALADGDPQRLGLYLDSLYELDEPSANQAIREVLDETTFPKAYIWRYVKSILKRAMLRHDATMFGWLAHRMERQSRTRKGIPFASLKSGYDGVQRPTPVFSLPTQYYVRRSTWRYLRQLAGWRPELYTRAAAQVLIHYDEEDLRQPKGRYGQFADCTLWHQILLGNSQRFVYDDRRLRFRYKGAKATSAPTGVREESFPEIWDAYPLPYLELLARGKRLEVQAFAYQAVTRSHPDLLTQATADQLAGMLQATYEPTLQLAAQELHRRFDPSDPDFSLLDTLIHVRQDDVIAVVHAWLAQTAVLWSADAERVVRYLQVEIGSTQALVVELAAKHLTDPSVRIQLAREVLAQLRDPQAARLEGMAQFARSVLGDDLNEMIDAKELLGMLVSESAAATSVAAELLSRRPNALVELGLPRVATLAEHHMLAVRLAAHQLLQAARSELQADPSLLFLLIESRWEDTRAQAMKLLQTSVDWGSVDLAVLMGVLDSNRGDVQAFGLAQMEAQFSRLDSVELVFRLSQHPHPTMRNATLGLVEQHLPAGIESLVRLEPFFRAGLFDTWPRRRLKHGIIEFLLRRGLQDRDQAEFVVRLLGEFVCVEGQNDFERALQALTQLQLAFDNLPSPVVLRSEVG